MTTPSTPRKAGPLNGTGSQTSWPFSFKVFAAADLRVTIANSAGVETDLVLNSDYSVSLNANQETSPGGTVTYPISGSALPVGSKITVIGDLDYDQPLDLPSGGNFNPVAIENELDRIVMQVQQLKEQSDRSARLPVTYEAVDVESITADIVRLADSADNIDTAVANIADINTVASDLNEPVSEINTVAGSIANVNTVGNNIANVNTVAGINANVTAVAGNATNINAVAGNATNINAVAANETNIDAVASNAANINAAVANELNIDAVVANATNINAVAANETNIDAVAGNEANINAVVANETNIDAVAGNAANINEVADNLPVIVGLLDQVGDGVVERYVGGVDYTVNTTTSLTLPSVPAKANTVKVFFAGVYQESNNYTLSGATLTFTSAIPATSVEVTYDVGRSFAELDAAVADAEASATTAASLVDTITNLSALLDWGLVTDAAGTTSDYGAL